MLGDLARHGFNVIEDAEEADAIIINSCAFIEDAKSESLEVGGCLAVWLARRNVIRHINSYPMPAGLLLNSGPLL